MRRRRFVVHGLGVGLSLLALAGCGPSPASKFYLLSATATPGGAATAHYAVVVGPVTIPAAVDRPQLVLQVAPQQVSLDEFSRWVAPLQDEIGRTVAADLAALLGSTRVTSSPLPNFDASFRVTIDVQRFESIPGDAAVIEALWAVRSSAGRPARTGRTLAREEVETADVDALVAAHSRALGVVSGDIARAIRAAASAGD